MSEVEARARAAARVAATRPGLTVAVTNEVGLGLIPDNQLGRTYRDLLGRVNTIWAEAADRYRALLKLDAHCVKNPKKCLKTRQLMSQDGQIVTDLVWSPDSQYIAYLQSDDPLGVTTNLGDVWVVDVQMVWVGDSCV